jgi:hypothetical protein
MVIIISLLLIDPSSMANIFITKKVMRPYTSIFLGLHMPRVWRDVVSQMVSDLVN